MSLEDLGKKIGRVQSARPATFLLLMLIITIATVPGLPLLIDHVEPSIEKVLPQDVAVVRLMNEMRAQYGADMTYLLIVPDPRSANVHDMRDPLVLDYVDTLAQRLRDEQNIREVQTLADLVKRDNGGFIPRDQEVLRNSIATNPLSGMFIDENAGVMVVHIRSDTGSSAELIAKVTGEIKQDINDVETMNPGLNVRMTGFNTIDKATFEIIIHDFMFITGFSFLFMLTFLMLYYKGDVRKVLLSMSVIMLALIWTLGVTGYLGVTITVVTMVAAAMIMALGISYGIHVVHRYTELRASADRVEALAAMQGELVRALLGSSLTTSAGFLALLFGVLPAMKNLGIVLALGITITLIVSLFFTPVLVFMTDRTKENNGTRKRVKKKHD